VAGFSTGGILVTATEGLVSGSDTEAADCCGGWPVRLKIGRIASSPVSSAIFFLR